MDELSSSVDRLTATVQTFQAFLAYSQGETFLQKRLAELEEERKKNQLLVGGLEIESHGIVSAPVFEQTIPPAVSPYISLKQVLYQEWVIEPLIVLYLIDGTDRIHKVNCESTRSSV